MKHECYFCITKTVEKLIEKHEPTPAIAEDFVFSVHQLIGESRERANPYLAADIHRLAKQKLNHSNLYQQEKQDANKLLLEQYDYWKRLVEQHSNPLYAAAKLAVIGNIIDYGAHSVGDDIIAQINALYQKDFAIDQTEELIAKIKKARRILYLGDNAGEIVFDKLFIEAMNHPGVTYAVRNEPVINDVTFEDASQTGLDQICSIISNGYDAPSTLLEHCTDEFIEHYYKADLIISKGQGNFEGQYEKSRVDLYFLLIAKCKPMSELLGVNKGDMVVTNLRSNERVL